MFAWGQAKAKSGGVDIHYILLGIAIIFIGSNHVFESIYIIRVPIESF